MSVGDECDLRREKPAVDLNAELWSLHEVMAFLKVGRSSFNQLRRDPTFPNPFWIGDRIARCMQPTYASGSPGVNVVSVRRSGNETWRR